MSDEEPEDLVVRVENPENRRPVRGRRPGRRNPGAGGTASTRPPPVPQVDLVQEDVPVVAGPSNSNLESELASVSSERDALRKQLEQLRAKKRKREPVLESSDDDDDTYSSESDSDSSSSSSTSVSSSSSSSSDERKKKKKKKGKGKGKGKKKRVSKKTKGKGKGKAKKKKGKEERLDYKRARNPDEIIRRYLMVLKIYKKNKHLGRACRKINIDRNTITLTAPIAELAISDPVRYAELLSLRPPNDKLGNFAHVCLLEISHNRETKERVEQKKSELELLPIKPKGDN